MVDYKFINFWEVTRGARGLELMTISGAGGVEVWDLATRKKSFRFPKRAKHGAQFGPNGSVLARPLNARNQIWFADRLSEESKVVFEQDNPHLSIGDFATSPCRNWLAIANVAANAEKEGYDPVQASEAIGITFVNLSSGKQSTVTSYDKPLLKLRFCS